MDKQFRVAGFTGNAQDVTDYLQSVLGRRVAVSTADEDIILYDITDAEFDKVNVAAVKAWVAARISADVADAAAQVTERSDVLAAYSNLNTYIGLTSPTNAQTVAVVKLLCRVVIVLGKRALGVK